MSRMKDHHIDTMNRERERPYLTREQATGLSGLGLLVVIALAVLLGWGVAYLNNL